MLLSQYRSLTAQLFQAQTSTVPLVTQASLDNYINLGRSQVASEGECIRSVGSLSLVAAQNNYGFDNIDTNIAQAPGVLTVRSGRVGDVPLDFRPWEWFAAYYWKAGAGSPTVMAQQKQGAFGSLWFFPSPTAVATVLLDVVCLPLFLVDDSVEDVLPYPWTDAVPFYAAWLAMMNAQRQSDAEMMFGRYEQAMMRLARMGATPSEFPRNVPVDRGLPPPQASGGR